MKPGALLERGTFGDFFRGSRSRSALACCLLLAVGTGCSRMRGVSRCRALAESVNQTLDAVEHATAAPKPGAAAYRTASTHYAALAKELEGFDAQSPELAVLVAELADVMRSAKEQTGMLSDALASNTAGTKLVAQKELDRLARRQKVVAQRIAQKCTGH